MKINLSDILRKHSCQQDWSYYFLMNVMCNNIKDPFETFKIKPYIIKDENGNEHYGDIYIDVNVQINGIEVPFDSFINELQKDYSDNVKVAAQNLLFNKIEVLKKNLTTLININVNDLLGE